MRAARAASVVAVRAAAPRCVATSVKAVAAAARVQTVSAARVAVPARAFSAAAAAKKSAITVKKVEGADGPAVSVELPASMFTTHECEGPSGKVEISVAQIKEIFHLMNLVRRTEVAADQLYKQKLIRGFLHLYNGQEAVACALRAACRKEDQVITAYRCHAHMLERGGTAREVIGELMGKPSGCAKGKGGSMHMYSFKNNFHGGNGIVGAQIPIGAGLGFAEKYKGTDNVALTFYGDGAANQGQAFEAYNMAKLWDVPCIFVTENNHYGMGTSQSRSSADTNYFKRAGYISGLRFDGMNLFSSIAAFSYAAEWCRSGKGPFMLEADTYRYYGHSMSDPGLSYRTKDEVREVRETRDPINYVKNFLLENELATADEIKEIEKATKTEVDEAVAACKAEPDPEAHELYTHVMVDPYHVRAVDPANSRNIQP